jgi:ketosteroid isomerase-like protein
MRIFSLFILILLLSSCTNRQADVEKAIQNYDRLIFKMAADSIADCFTDSGTLGGEGMPLLVSRDSIRRFLRSFDASSIKMISNRSQTKSVVFKGDTAIQEGNYEQKAEVNGKLGVYMGTFVARWLQGKDGKWRLLSMYTVPSKN